MSGFHANLATAAPPTDHRTPTRDDRERFPGSTPRPSEDFRHARDTSPEAEARRDADAAEHNRLRAQAGWPPHLERLGWSRTGTTDPVCRCPLWESDGDVLTQHTLTCNDRRAWDSAEFPPVSLHTPGRRTQVVLPDFLAAQR